MQEQQVEQPEVTPLENEDILDQFDQDEDADLSGVEIRNKHFMIKAPAKKTDSDIILPDHVRKNIQSVQDMPEFKEDITVVKKAANCTMVEEGQMIILSPHVNVLEMVVDNVLYLLIHEDFVLATKDS